MKTHLSFLALLCMLLFTFTPNLFAQCTIPLLDIKDSVTIKALRRYVDVADATNSKYKGKFIDKKKTIVLLQEKQTIQADGKILKLMEVNMSETNYYKFWKLIITGYFYVDEFLFVVISPRTGSFITNNYDYDTCLSQVLQNHTIREYDSPKTFKKILHNQEVTMKEMGESIDMYSARITINLLDKITKEPYSIQFYK